MTFYRFFFSFALTAVPTAVLFAGASVLSPAGAADLSGPGCHAAFQAAKASGTLNGLSYLAFKAANCSKDAAKGAPESSAPSSTQTTPAAPSSTAAQKPETPSVSTMTGKEKAEASATADAPMGVSKPATGKGAQIVSGKAVFPTAIAPQFAKLSTGKARLKTCAVQYQANKANGGNGGLTWIAKGGGYWSACNAHLKSH